MVDERQDDLGPEAREDPPHRGWRAFVRENWYRDVWLLLITLFVVAVTLVGFASIQESRYQAALLQCLQRNSANVMAKERLDELLANVPPAQAQRTKDFSIVLIDAMVPFERDCEGRARELVATG